MSHPHLREVAVFEAALQLPPERREAYLQQTCAGAPDLLERIRALLRADESQTDFLAQAASATGPTLAASLPPTEKPGDSIGPYKLLQQIGEGGCGVVYMAEQEKPIRRRLALKIIKLGMDTRQVVARFEAERQALALMDHPNIAKVYDAGATETGRPYFVMELVRGVKITDYCDEKRLSTQQRLELFIQVCQAVQHAHQKGIIHRDLKPSNILVTVNDGVAVPKVIDFGIAKVISGERLTDKTVFTAFEQFIGTPAYMSPEQAEITSLDIDTRSDIYSLGVLLYELLTGQTPFDAKELLQAGLDEMRRTIREQEPVRPSTRLGTLGAEELTTAAQRRGLDSPKLINLLRGDLDWIAMKCLEKDRARRYETANGLAMDIHRHLNNEPVIARPPSRLYEFQKTVRKHWVGFVATSAVMATLVVGLALSSNLYSREQKAKTEAIRQAAIADAAQTNALEELRNSLLSEARALRWSNRASRRFEGLELLQKAAAIRPGLDLRNEAIASMVLTDLRMGKALDLNVPDNSILAAFDADYERYAIANKQDGTVTLRRLADDFELARFSGYGPSFWNLQWSPDGRYLFIAFGPKHDRIEVRDLVESKVAMTQTGQNFRSAEFSADSGMLVISFESEASHFPIDVFDVATGAMLASFPHRSLPWRVSFNPTLPDLLLSSDGSDVVRLWNWRTGSVIRTLPHPSAVRGISWSPDGKTAATACSDTKVRIWDTTTGEARAVLSGHESDTVFVTFSGDGALLASRGWDGRACLWDVAVKREIARATAPGLMWPFSQHGRQLGMGVATDKIRILEATAGCGYHALQFEFNDQPAGNCAFSADGRLLLSAHPNCLNFWDTASGKNLLRFPLKEGEHCAFFHPDGKRLFVGTREGVEEWALTDFFTTQAPGLAFHHKWDMEDRQYYLTFDHDYKRIATSERGAIHVFDISTGMDMMRIAPKGYTFSSLSNDGRLVAAWSEGEVLQVDVWDVATTNLLRSLGGSSGMFAAFSPNNRWLALGDKAQYRLWDVRGWKSIYTVPREFAGFYGYLAFSPDSKLLAVAISRSMVQLRDAATGQELATLEAPEQSQVTWIAFSPDSSQVAVVCSVGAIQLWDLRPIRRQLAGMKLDWGEMPHKFR